MANPIFRVVHMDHSGTTISIHTPVGDSLHWSYKATDTGDIAYDLSLTDDAQLIAAESVADSHGEAFSFAPYKTDWRLGMQIGSAGWNTIHAGIHTNVSLKPRTGVVEVIGRDWSEWLNQNVWFLFYTVDFDVPNFKELKAFLANIQNDAAFDGNGFLNANDIAYVWVGRLGATQRSVITDLIQLSVVGIDPVIITPTFNGSTSWAQLTSYAIQIQDETTYLDHIKSVSALGEPYGFDFTMNHNKVMEFFGPRLKVESSPDPIWTLDETNVVIDTVPEFDWVNNGPVGTYIYAMGPGSPAIWEFKTDIDSEILYRRWLRLTRVGDLYQRNIADVKYATRNLQMIFPHKDLRLSIYPDKVNPDDIGDGFRNHVGDVVRFRWPVPPYHTINAFFWITQQDIHIDAAGNGVCDLGLQQIYG